MALSKLENLYRQIILDHSSHPHNHGVLENFSQSTEMNNPTCGDVIHLELQLKDGMIEEIAFSGQGCSISTASASMMTEIVKGQTVEKATTLAEEFSLLVQGKEVTNVEELGDAEILQGVSKFPARIKCATLPWEALKKVIANSAQK
ncbi:SUF system NifU family Fe-S cluster assembly protein [Tetragenococcus osmophilus]|uniref:Iron-sulfur cluster assembly scaffold protein n=1 Tax=Tetragenococcus osmophilus TaxID=526944 RepID=A0AA37XM23_9ENTE|nr:SUF system NifU family Fe-S cluster assembly protein [Tetragenococcus osmophilus]AYW48040.1 SUF system NifU family Fe-S cluster assembly protein [Tetragenococcus osmophilus]GMA53771.1 iron-sulfur cluster assembly scaffold protein [Alicyclobacillus contaminans]GMA72304.1 iron-sulfur cluster assembly scaffold protein [Tetragenococcus osmophilus]